MSSPERVQNLLAAASELAPQERAAFLDAACGGNSTLRAEVESLLKSHDQAGRFLADPTADIPSGSAGSAMNAGHAAVLAASVHEGPGTRIGPYKLLQLIGEGGFGSVFMAEQEKPVARKVALKIIKLGMDTRQVVARFEQERQALALMDHPNIAKVLDAGATETGRPFFVMELVKGQPITAFCDEGKLSIHDRLDLLAQVCTAVQHAHTKGIIHRDIKPSNVLVSVQDGKPYAKVIDFGIAKATSSKLTEKTLFTQHAQIIGTPEYMSPEQAQGSLDIDTRTDVYSLGVLLYELLTGTTPFSGAELRSAAYEEIRRIIREVDPPTPSTRLSQSSGTIATVAALRRSEPKRLGLAVRGELDWIVMKAMDKDRMRRYETASGLASDIRRYLAGEAIAAAPPGATYRLMKLVRRNRGAVIAGAAVAAALLIGVIGFAWQASVARAQRDLALAAKEAEAQQRAAADTQRDRALAAEAETRARAGELKQVAAFQSKMLSGIDPAGAGEALAIDIRDRFNAALAKSGVPEDQRASRTEAFTRELGEVNTTDAAVELIDRSILKPAIAAVGTQFNDQPIVDASLRHSLAEIYTVLGRYDDAAELEERALETRRRLLGDENPETLLAINNMGSILEAKGDLARAEKLYQEAVDKNRRVLGLDDPDTLRSMGNLGNFYRAQGKLADAEPLAREALEGMRRVLGVEHRDTLIAMNTYGYLLIEQGKAKDAEPYWREAYETGTRVFGPDDRDVLVWVHNMGGLLGSLGRDKEAEQMFRAALDATRRVRGENHPATMNCLGSLAFNFEKQGRSAEAEALFREMVAVNTRTLGPDHPDTLLGMKRLAGSLRTQGKLEEAEICQRDTVARCRRALGNEHPTTLLACGALASLLNEEFKSVEAEAIYRDVLEVLRRTKGEENPDTLVTLNNLVGTLINQGRTQEADTMIQPVVEIRRRVSGANDPETAIAISSLARLREDQHRPADAEPLWREALDIFRRTIGSKRANTLGAAGRLGALLTDQGKLREAEPLCREAVSGLEAILGKAHPKTAAARLDLGRLLIAARRYPEAEPELIEAQNMLAAAKNVSVGRRKLCAEALVSLYTAWDASEPGKDHEAKAQPWKQKLGELEAAAGAAK